MPQIQSIGPGNAGSVDRTSSVSTRRTERFREESAAVAPRREDRVEISDGARLASPASSAPDRAARIDAIRTAIENGSYETDERLELASQRLLRDLLGH